MSDQNKRHMPIEQTGVFIRFTAVADEIWEIARKWDGYAKATVAIQLVKAADSIGANLVEGDGRPTDPDALRFFGYSRGSARETQYWLGVACRRRLLPKEDATRLIAELDEAGKMLYGLMEYRRRSKFPKRVQETTAAYGSDSSLEPSAQSLVPPNSRLEPSAQSLEPSNSPLEPSAKSLEPSNSPLEPSAKSLEPDSARSSSMVPDSPRAWSLEPSASEFLTDDQL